MRRPLNFCVGPGGRLLSWRDNWIHARTAILLSHVKHSRFIRACRCRGFHRCLPRRTSVSFLITRASSTSSCRSNAIRSSPETTSPFAGYSCMSDRSEWNLLKKQFNALMRDETARLDDLEQLFDHQIRRRFGEAIASAMGDQTDYGVRFPTDDAP